MRARPCPSLAVAALLAVAGCGQSPKTMVLTLDTVPAATVRGGYRGLPIAVPAVHMPAAIDRAEFVRQTRPGTLDIDDFARWSAPLGVLARDVLVRDLTQRLPAGSVLPPGAVAVAGRSTVYDVTVLGLATDAGGGTLEASFRRLPAGRPRIVSYAATANGPDPAAAAGAVSALLSRLADDIAADADADAADAAAAPR